MRVRRTSSLVGMVAVLTFVVGIAAAQPMPDYLRITPPAGMRWKSLDQSGITSDNIFVDKNGDTWLRKSAAATFTRSFVLVQLVGDSGGTDKWMDLVENMPRYLGLRPDSDWANYGAFTADANWRALITSQRELAFLLAGPQGLATPRSAILPIYRSASDPSVLWSTPDQGPFPQDAVLTGDFDVVPRVKAGTDIPYTVTVQDLFTDPPSEITRPGGYELYRNYYPQFNDDGSLSLTVAGDFSFQKDYLLPEGPPCAGGLPRMPDGSCADGTTDIPAPIPNDGGTPTAGGGLPPTSGSPESPAATGGPVLGGPPLVAPEPTAAPAPPLVPPTLSQSGCAAVSGAVLDLCGEASGRAQTVGTIVPLPPVTLHVNPNLGVVHIPDWFWAEGYDGGPRTVTRQYSLPWSRPGNPIVDPDTGAVIGYTAGSSGTYDLTVTVRYRPARYRWAFGDGADLDTSSLGQAYPLVSDVQHAYSSSSLGQPGDQYTYRLVVDWVGDWQVAGDASGSGTLPSQQSIYAARQLMREVQQLRCPDTGCVP